MKGHRKVICPYCGLVSEKTGSCSHCAKKLRQPVRIFLKHSLFIMALLSGLLLWQWYMSQKAIPVIQIASISSRNNWSNVAVQGTLVSDALESKSGAVHYLVDDGSAILSVSVPTREKQPPFTKGQRVRIQGRLSFGPNQSVRMNATGIEIIPELTIATLYEAYRPSQITEDQMGQTLRVAGRVVTSVPSAAESSVPSKIVIADSLGTLDVVYWLDPIRGLSVTNHVVVEGVVDSYNDSLQLKVHRLEDIAVYPSRVEE